MDPKCKDCGWPETSRHCQCPSNPLNQPDPAKAATVTDWGWASEMNRIMQSAQPFLGADQ